MRVKSKTEWEAQQAQLMDALREFASVLQTRPFQNEEGLRGVSAFALYWFVKQARPTVVFEVGVWRGFSTWIIEQAAPNAEIFCFDPLFYLQHMISPERLGQTYRSPRATYSRDEFSCFDVPAVVARHARPLIFYDDHQNKFPRLLQAKALGVRDLVFDDNTAARPYTHRTLEHDRADPATAAHLEAEVDDYQIFPALWSFDWEFGGSRLKEGGLGFPVTPQLQYIHDERKWHSYVSYVKLKSP